MPFNYHADLPKFEFCILRHFNKALSLCSLGHCQRRQVEGGSLSLSLSPCTSIGHSAAACPLDEKHYHRWKRGEWKIVLGGQWWTALRLELAHTRSPKCCPSQVKQWGRVREREGDQCDQLKEQVSEPLASSFSTAQLVETWRHGTLFARQVMRRFASDKGIARTPRITRVCRAHL